MQCIVPQPLPFLVLQNAYLRCKDTDLIWIRANYYLKKDYSTVAFFDNFNRTTSCIFILHSSRYKCNPYFYYLSGSNSSIAQMACSSTFLM